MTFEVKYSDIHDRGCFATEHITEGMTFTFPVILVDNSNCVHLFPWMKEKKSIVIGPVTFCNSSSDPNLMILSIDRENLTKQFIAVRDIMKGAEVLLKYKI